MNDATGFSIERTIVIRAPRETVFRYFTDSERFAAWWGAGSQIDPRAGGRVRICYPGAVVAIGEIVEIAAPSRIVFTYGYEGESKPIAPGGSRVTISLSPESEGTRVRLQHVCEGVPSAVGVEHAQGWRYQMALFANVVSREVQAKAADHIDAFFSAWNQREEADRRRLLKESTTEDVAFHDAFSCTAGREDLLLHLAAFAIHMPGMSIARDGAVAQCQATALAPWVARAPDGSERGRGTNVFELSPEGLIRRATGFWNLS